MPLGQPPQQGEDLQVISTSTGISKLSMHEKKLTNFDDWERALPILERALQALFPEEKQYLNDEGVEIVLCDAGKANVMPPGSTKIEISPEMNEISMLSAIRSDMRTYRGNKSGTDQGIVFDPPVQAAPHVGTSPADTGTIVFDENDSSITPAEGLPAILLDEQGQVHEEPREEDDGDETLETSETSFEDLEFLPESEVDPANVQMDTLDDKPESYKDGDRILPIIKVNGKERFVTAIKGRRLKGISGKGYGKNLRCIAEFEDGKSLPVVDNRLIEDIDGKKISNIDLENAKVAFDGLTGIAYFEDAPYVPTFILDGRVVTHIDDIDISTAEKISFTNIWTSNTLVLKVTKDGTTSEFTVARATLKDGKLSQSKLQAKEKIEEEMQGKGIRISIENSEHFYENSEEFLKKIEASINMLTAEERALLRTIEATIFFRKHELNHVSQNIWARMSDTAEQMAASIRRQAIAYAESKGISIPTPAGTSAAHAVAPGFAWVPAVEPPKKAETKTPKAASPGMIQALMHTRLMQSKAGRFFVTGTLIGGLGLAAIKSATVDRAVGAVTTPLTNAATTFNAKAKALAEKIEAEKSQKPAASAESPKSQSTEIPSGTIVVPKSIDEAVKKGMIIVTPEGKKKPNKANGWEWTHEDISGFAKDDMERFSVTKM